MILMPLKQRLSQIKKFGKILIQGKSNGIWGSIRQQGTVQATAPVPVEGKKNLKIGDVINGFAVEQVEEIPEFQMMAIKMKHERTGGEYLHIERNDLNNVFGVGFRTTPLDSTGLPHILEHTTLTGSEKYPCRDPFFKMLNRSLATYMNASTGPDFTVYPFSTQNPQDYKNLMSVYLDAVFRPNLSVIDFRQEGWRLEHEIPTDASTPIVFKGVVFNEMKGVFSDNQNIFAEALLNHMLPSHTYGVCSGGDPLVIPQLTHGNLKNFHRDYYAPSNARYYSYGSFSLEEHTAFLEKEYLKERVPEPSDTAVPRETRWTQPVRRHVACRPDPLAADPAKQSSIAISHLCCDIDNLEEVFTLQIIAQLLVDGPNAAFYKTLIEPNIGAGFSPVTGFECHTRDTYFTVGLQGVAEADFERVIELCESTIAGVVKRGFDAEQVEGVLHEVELNTKHQTADFGLRLLYAITPTWMHGGDVVKLLKIEDKVKALRARMAADPWYLQKKVGEYFTDNHHRLVLTMSPTKEYEAELQEKERRVLEEKVNALDEVGRRGVYEDGLKLLADQKRDDKACLPTLRIQDLSPQAPEERLNRTNIRGVPFFVTGQPTNGVAYFRALLSTNELEEDLKPYLPLFADVATKMGTAKRDYREFDKLASLRTGGVNLSTHIRDSHDRVDTYDEALALSTYCLKKNVGPMFELVSEVLMDNSLEDEARFGTLAQARAAQLVNGLADSGHRYAMLGAASLVSPVSAAMERAGGMYHVGLMKSVAQNPGAALPKLRDIYKSAMNRGRLRCALNVLEGTEPEVLQESEKFVEGLAGELLPTTPIQGKPTDAVQGAFHVLPFSVSYTGKALLAVPYQHEDFAPLRVLTRLATMNYLHPEIREKGGAYGSGMSISTSGVVQLYSYRDPNPANTLRVFDDTADWLQNAKPSQQDIDEAKLGIFQTIDAPVPPGNKGMRLFLYGVSDEMLQKHREALKAVTKEQIVSVGSKYLARDVSSVGRCVIGPENKAVLSDKSQNWKTSVHD